MFAPRIPRRIVTPVLRVLALLLCVGLLWQTAGSTRSAWSAPLGSAFTYQGLLRLNDAPVNDLCDFQFSLWNGPNDPSTQIGSIQAHNAVPVNEGRFVIPELDFGTNAFNGAQRWLQIAVRCPAGGGAFETLAPRQQLTAAPYAHFASRAGSLPWTALEGMPSGFADGTDNDTLYSAGAGLTLAGTQFRVNFAGSGTAVTAAHSDHDHWGQTWAGESSGLRLEGQATYANSVGLHALLRPWGIGLEGVVAPPNTDAFMAVPTGVAGISLVQAAGISDRTYGVFGYATGDDSYGVFGFGNRIATAGVTEGDGGTGVYGESLGGGGVGVKGVGAVFGVMGEAENTTGVYGTGYTGVYGSTPQTNGNGVVGSANNGSVAYGVWGQSTQGYAGYFSGKVHVTGNLTKAGGSFKIDHPLDPANMYLYHSFVESPDMKNIYDGMVTLDGRGEATVTLPDWFEALNRDFRYQLTCVGGYAPVYIAREIENGTFTIGGGTPGLKVSWQVTGIRQDPWANDNRIPVEAPKPPEEAGTYLYPAGYGQSQTLGAEYARTQQLVQQEPATLEAGSSLDAPQDHGFRVVGP